MSVAEPESPVMKTPEWLEVLENKRNRPHKLAHDIGAGAPCLVCKDGCKGLNLHFWRKLCIECKCRKEDHEVQEDEDYAQFEILFGAKKIKRTTLKFDAQNKSFDWIPPNVAPELAVDYLKSIPQSKLPISNSEGARYRRQQLEKQVPLHDVDPNACFHLSDSEMKEFQKYLDNLKDNVIGQGKVLKYQSPKMLKENYIHGSSLNMITSSEEYGNVKPQGAQIVGQLSVQKMPEYNAFSQQLSTGSYPADAKFIKHFPAVNSTTNNSHPLGTQPLGKNNKNLSHDLHFSNPKPYQPFQHVGKEDSVTPGNAHVAQPSQLNLKTPSSFLKNFPDKQNNNAQPDKNCNVSFPYENTLNKLGKLNLGEEGSGNLYIAGINPVGNFNQMNVTSSEVPFVPVQESGNLYVPNKHVSGGDKSLPQDEGVNEDIPNTFPSPPLTCQQCLEILYPEEVVVQTERGEKTALWHAKCFVCETCKELLVDLMYFYNKGKVYCGRHYAEIMKIPRCYGCDELIFVKEYTIAEGQSYHVRHFCCFHCDEPLGGKQYIPKDSYPICLDCYQIKYGKNCKTCQLPIGPGEQRVSWKDLDFHVSPACFRCTQCLKSLLGEKFVVKNSNIFCSKECVQMFPG